MSLKTLIMLFFLLLFGIDYGHTEPFFSETMEYVRSVKNYSGFKSFTMENPYAEISILKRASLESGADVHEKNEILFNEYLKSYSYLNNSLRLGPLKDDNHAKLIEAHRIALGTDIESVFLNRLLLKQLASAPKIEDMWQFWLFNSNLKNITEPKPLPSDISLLKLELPTNNSTIDSSTFPVPAYPRDFLRYARIAFDKGNLHLAREAIERIIIMSVNSGLGNEIELIDLQKDTPRPLPEQWSDQSSSVATVALLLVEKDQGVSSEKEIKLGVFHQVVMQKIKAGYANGNLLVPVDLIQRIIAFAKVSPQADFSPDFSRNNGFLLFLSKEEGEPLYLFGNLDKTGISGCLFLIANNRSFIIDDPECLYTLDLILKSLNVFSYLKSPEYSTRKIFSQIGMQSSTSASPLPDQGMNYLKGQIRTTFIYQAGAPDMEPIEYEGLQWVSTATDTPSYSFSWMRARHGADNEIPEAAPKMLEITRKIRERLAAVAGEMPAGCHVYGITGDESINREPPEERWLRAWSIRHGLPVGNELRKLLRLYKIIGAPLPDRISLRMPLLFRANLANPRRPEGEHDMISGYWFDELELLVIADFDTDAGSPLGRFAAESVGLKGELAAENARIVLYDGFNFKNHGLRLAIPAGHKAGDKIAAELEKHQIKPAEDSMMLENPEAYSFFASISDRVYFILSEKDKPLQMRIAEEPER